MNVNLDIVQIAAVVFQWLLFGLMVLYLIFSFIIIREARLMHKSFVTVWGPVFRIAAIIHFVVILVLVILALNTLLLT